MAVTGVRREPHAASEEARREVAAVPVRTAPGEPETLLALQRTAGNRAVGRRLQRKEAAKAQPTGTGLREATRSSAFATAGLDFWKDPANKDKPLKDYSDHLVAKANAALKALGSYEVKPEYNASGGDSGSFSRVTWSITINTKFFSKRSGVSKVGDLTLDEAAEIADTIYHEIRHSEQYFRIARMQAAQSKKTAAADVTAEIKKAMDIPPAVAQAAAGAPLAATKENQELLAEAKDWESITVGLHGTYKGVINEWSAESREARAAADAVDAKNIAATKATIGAHVKKWKESQYRFKFIATHLAVVEPITAKTRMDELVVKHLKAVQVAMVKVDAAWKAVEDNWAKDDDAKKLSRLQALQAPLAGLRSALYDAYRDHLHEKDAWEAGGAVGKEFREKGKPKK